MVGYEGHRGWINYLAVTFGLPERTRLRPSHHAGGGNASEEGGVPEINLQVRSTNSQVIEFYRSIGFEVA